MHLYLFSLDVSLPEALEGLRAELGDGGEGCRAPATADMVSLREGIHALAIEDRRWSTCGGGGGRAGMVHVGRRP